MLRAILFYLVVLDTSARRFEAGKIIKPLEELSRITSLWQRLKKLATDNKLSDSQLHAIITLLVNKKEKLVADSAEYSQLAEAILHKERLGYGNERRLNFRPTPGRL